MARKPAKPKSKAAACLPRGPRTILIAAGEASGDILGAELMAELKRRDPMLRFAGVGGAKMRGAGLESLGDISLFPGMGLAEVLPAVPRLLALRNRLAAWAETHKPALCLTIDNQEFSARLAAKVAPLGIPCVQYVAPKVWAWRQNRVHKLKRVFKHVLCLFPFEADFFNAHGLPATYIGHPILQRFPETSFAIPGAKRPGTQGKRPVLALLPGSRPAELSHHWPLFLQTYQRLRKQTPALTGLVAVPDDTALARLKTLGWDDSLKAATGDARFKALAACTAALTKSGTNNLELALMHIPAVVAYRMNGLTHGILKHLLRVRIPFISPPNLILQKYVYPEFVQDRATPQALAAAVKPLLAATPARAKQMSQLQKVREALEPPQSPLKTAGDVISGYLA